MSTFLVVLYVSQYSLFPPQFIFFFRYLHSLLREVFSLSFFPPFFPADGNTPALRVCVNFYPPFFLMPRTADRRPLLWFLPPWSEPERRYVGNSRHTTLPFFRPPPSFAPRRPPRKVRLLFWSFFLFFWTFQRAQVPRPPAFSPLLNQSFFLSWCPVRTQPPPFFYGSFCSPNV